MSDIVTLQLHGFYNYRDAITSAKPEDYTDGAIAYNPKFKEIVVHIDNDWYFIEGDSDNEAESTLHAELKKLFEEKGEGAQKAVKEFNLECSTRNKSGDMAMNILKWSRGVAVAAAAKKEPVERPDYNNVRDFGVF